MNLRKNRRSIRRAFAKRKEREREKNQELEGANPMAEQNRTPRWHHVH